MNKFNLNELPPEEDELGVQENQPPEAHGAGFREGSNVEIDLNELPKPDGIREVIIFNRSQQNSRGRLCFKKV